MKFNNKNINNLTEVKMRDLQKYFNQKIRILFLYDLMIQLPTNLIYFNYEV